MPITFRIKDDDEGLRLDKFLRRELPEVPLSHIFKLLRTRKVRLNDRRARGEDRLAPGDTIVVRGDPERLAARPEQVGRVQTRRRDFEVLHEDAHLVAVVKPAGLAIHPGTGISGATLVDQVRAWLGAEPDAQGFTPSPAHRLDKETSGVVLVARTRKAMVALTETFASGGVTKTYLALVKGKMPGRRGEIDLPLQEHQQTARSKAIHGKRHQPALTRWKLVAGTARVSLVEVDLGTGRTHQIRRHFAAIGHPVVGDRRHGDFPFNREAKASWGASRQMLHAWKLSFAHPFGGERLDLVAPVPGDMRDVADRAGVPFRP
jgi:23S rRNA pseudouridine955/2504/2580 synthase